MQYQSKKICIPVITPERANKRQNGRRFKEDGDPAFTLTSQDRHGIAVSLEVIGDLNKTNNNLSKSAFAVGIDDTYGFDGIRVYDKGVMPTLRSSRQGLKIMQKIDIDDNHPGMYVELEDGCIVYAIWYPKYECYITIRKLTPKECFRLQGWSDDYFEKAQFINSDSQLYKQAGNAITVPVVEEIAKKLSTNKKLKVLELFAGTRSVSKAFEARGHEVYCVEWDKSFDNIDLYQDISKLTAEEILKNFGHPDVIWASPDCTSYSVAAISKHRRREDDGNLSPVTDYAKFCDQTNSHVIELIKELNPKYWFIENPRGGMRKMRFMQDLPRYTVTYCQYGETRMKPTDIWTNHPDPKFKPPCKNGDPCHERAPRGARTGTQKIKGAIDRARIPKELCEHIVDICEEG